MMKKICGSLVFFFLIILGQISFAQVFTTGFEGPADETVFNNASWTTQGFSTRFVNGFNVNRAHIDNAFAVSGTNSLRILYPSGNYGPVTSGSGAQAPLILTPANQYYASYWVRFADNFTWGTTSYGGKLPGLAGGGNCSGCNNCTGTNGFSARLMWRTNGRLVLYLYHMDKVNPPCGDDITLKLSGVDYLITKGQWFKITERVKVNTGTNHDGEVELWINNQPALLKTGIQFVSNGDKVDNFYFSTFHGGSNATWGPTSDTYTWFDDLRIGTNSGDFFGPLTMNEEKLIPNKPKSTELISSIYPQPAYSNGYINISIDSAEDSNILVEWYELSGKLIFQSILAGQNTSNQVPTVKSGFYILKLQFEDKVLTQKVLIE